MNPQLPAEGILKSNDWGNSKHYQVMCGCGQSAHEHTVEVEADDMGINVNIYVTVKTDYWSDTIEKSYTIDNVWLQEFDWFWKDLINGIIRRLKVTWEVWTTGAVTTETTISMTEQQTLNYAETLKSAIKDVEEFRKKRSV